MYSVSYKYKILDFDSEYIGFKDYSIIVKVDGEDIADAADTARKVFRQNISLFCNHIEPDTVMILHRVGIDFLAYCRKNIEQIDSVSELLDDNYRDNVINDWETIVEYMFKYLELIYDRTNNYYVPEGAVAPDLSRLNRVKKTIVEEWIKNFVRENFEVLIEHIPLKVEKI